LISLLAYLGYHVIRNRISGGAQAEREERDRQQKEREDKDRRNHEAFRKLLDDARKEKEEKEGKQERASSAFEEQKMKNQADPAKQSAKIVEMDSDEESDEDENSKDPEDEDNGDEVPDLESASAVDEEGAKLLKSLRGLSVQDPSLSSRSASSESSSQSTFVTQSSNSAAADLGDNARVDASDDGEADVDATLQEDQLNELD